MISNFELSNFKLVLLPKTETQVSQDL